MSPQRLSVLLVLLSSLLAPSTAVRSSTLFLARSPHSVSPSVGAPVTTWAATLAAQSASDAARAATLAAGTRPGPLVSDAAKKGPRRSFVPIAPGRQLLSIPSYVARALLGTPAQPLLVAIDSSNDTAWVPCTACAGCAPAPAPSFDPTRSSTYRPVRCGAPQCSQVPSPSCPGGAGASCAFNMSYAASTFQALLGQDALALALDVVVVAYTFGCLHC